MFRKALPKFTSSKPEMTELEGLTRNIKRADGIAEGCLERPCKPAPHTI
jgi:hypothetical protein